MTENEPESILVVTPHPDDSESAAGGTIAKWCAEGKKVVLVVCTNGDKGTSDRSIKPADLAATREVETLNAAKAYGLAGVVFLRMKDQSLEDNDEFREKIVRQIRIHKPRLLLTIDPNRPYIRHRDHSMTGRVTLDAVFPYARDHVAYPEHLAEGIEPHKVQEVWLFRPEHPDHHVDVTEYFETRQNAFHSHVSQVGERSAERDERTRKRLADTGKNYGVELAEQFMRIDIGR
ncbi:MAG TPA: PIG-L deacetylase family protein [Dehalococcoidia bacterium]|jgi:LmbE family N-acetylglucosaminyl deacetylase|nr:GlcNAc-PI de-N-acetylase [Chloroflexota bacterium]MDP6055200.1 PIG-L deacetylase family protein [Dehalococcoidia bacterium]MDP7089909.1 PIG-L deacetylase family protein [Dehalococcoidia bacterium]MDP7261222.1 PIG-L deacetylase family protein [Dehalococcoidia bacterium]MDP7486061.1 PIG-L deacetylase family protein [Dehalococcoidia bacterium]|tara:strand:+ start:2035 stop:2733 length:699 start_codon:yes stop_codon:yes gene_type:complete